jgi:hypothetical protein
VTGYLITLPPNFTTSVTEPADLRTSNATSAVLSALTGKHPAVCRAMESLVKEFVGASVHECCERAQRPRCCFEIKSRRPSRISLVADKVRQSGAVPGGQLQLRGKFSEDHPIARGISDRGSLHVV